MNAITRLFQTDTVAVCTEVLDFWLYECSLDAAPDAPQVAVWRDIFHDRGDRFARLAATCQHWLDEEGRADE